MSLYVCGLLTNADQVIPDDGGYHVLRFGYALSPDEEQTDKWCMHEPDNHPDGHVVTNWQSDPYSGLIYPAVEGYGRLDAMIQWLGADFRSRDRFARDPIGFTPDPVNTTNTEDRTHRFNAKVHEIYVYPDVPLAVQVRNMSGINRIVTHAQFKLYIETDIAVPPAGC